MDSDIMENYAKQSVKYKTKMQEIQDYNKKNELNKDFKLQNNKSKLNFIKQHQQKNAHDVNPERAQSIVKNFIFDKNVATYNPFFNKKEKEEAQTDYQLQDLFELNQISE